MNLSLFVFNFSIDAFKVNFTTFSKKNAIEGIQYVKVKAKLMIFTAIIIM